MNECEQIDWLFADSLLKYTSNATAASRTLLASAMAASRSGHLCTQLADAQSLPEELVQRVDEGTDLLKKPLCLYGNLLYFQKNWVFESRVIRQIRRLKEAHAVQCLDGVQVPEDLNAEQSEALRQALSHPVSLITGGPGTGKTYTAARLITTFLSSFSGRIAVAAPTGKAAATLERALAKIAKIPSAVSVGTLHALLGQRLKSEEEIPLPYDLIIVDESSMIDAPLFASLLASVSNETHLVLMGDVDQLPPVEVGSLYADILELNLFPSVRLVECMRSKGAILTLADAVRTSSTNTAIELIQNEGLLIDLGFSGASVGHIYERLWQAVRGRYDSPSNDEAALAGLSAFRILSCLRSGPLGVDALNRFLVKQFYMHTKPGEFLVCPVIVTRNDAELDLFNGQMGVMIKKREGMQFEPSEEDVLIFPGRRLSASMLSHFEFAYCLSVHKAQGSEYDEVLLLVPPGSEHFGKEVLYTAITRTRDTLKIDGNLEIIKEAIETSSRKRSGLKERLFCSSFCSELCF